VSKLRKNTALIPFEAASGFLMVLIVAAMAFISCFALTASLMASKLADGWSDGLIGSATVRIDATAEGSAQRVADVLDILRTTDGITDDTGAPRWCGPFCSVRRSRSVARARQRCLRDGADDRLGLGGIGGIGNCGDCFRRR